MTLRIQRFGDAAFRLALPAPAHEAALLRELRATPRVVDAVVCEAHALVTFEPSDPPSVEGLTRAVDAALAAPAPAAPARTHLVRIRYDGVDLPDMARSTGMSPAQIAAAHAAVRYRVAFLGFLPGFAYLRGGDPRLLLPRRASPRTRVPPGAVGVAGPYTGIYPFASPGGWNLVGTVVGFAPFDARHGAALAPGDEVCFQPEEA